MGNADWRGVKEVYMWSSKDVLLDDEKLEGLVETRRRGGGRVWKWRVEDSEHVLLLRKHRRKYMGIIEEQVHRRGLLEEEKEDGMKGENGNTLLQENCKVE